MSGLEFSAASMGETYKNKIVKTEVMEIDRFGPNPQAEFRLIVLDRVYKVAIPMEKTDSTTCTQVWTELFSTFLADLNFGLVAKSSITANP